MIYVSPRLFILSSLDAVFIFYPVLDDASLDVVFIFSPSLDSASPVSSPGEIVPCVLTELLVYRLNWLSKQLFGRLGRVITASEKVDHKSIN